MALFNRWYTTSYQTVIVSISVSCIVGFFKIFDAEEYRDLKTWIMGHSHCESMHMTVRH